MVKKFKLVFIGFISTQVFASANIALERRDVDGLKQIAIFKDAKSWKLTMNSNQLDIFTDAQLGKFGITNSKDLEKYFNGIDGIYASLKKIDLKLREQDQSFAKLNPITGHGAYIKVGEFALPQSHSYYKELYKIFEKITSIVKTKKEDVVSFQIGDMGPELIYFKDDKQIAKEPFSLNFNCSMQDNNRVCEIKKYGHLQILRN